jgi:hypothetical protein
LLVGEQPGVATQVINENRMECLRVPRRAAELAHVWQRASINTDEQSFEATTATYFLKRVPTSDAKSILALASARRITDAGEDGTSSTWRN